MKLQIIKNVLILLNHNRDLDAINLILTNKKHFPLTAKYILQIGSTENMYRILYMMLEEL